MIFGRPEGTISTVVLELNRNQYKYINHASFAEPLHNLHGTSHRMSADPCFVTWHIVQLTIYDISGREVKTLVDQRQNTGQHSVTFDASDFASGIYFYKLTTSAGFVQSRKMVVLK